MRRTILLGAAILGTAAASVVTTGDAEPLASQTVASPDGNDTTKMTDKVDVLTAPDRPDIYA
jgi:hypothetical protein